MTDYDLIIFDADGTLWRGTDGKYCPIRRGGWELIHGVHERVQALAAQGQAIAVATNMPPLYRDWHADLREMAWRILRPADFSMHVAFPEKGKIQKGRAKPAPAMLLEAMAEHCSEPASTLMVGDSVDDHQRACRLGLRVGRRTLRPARGGLLTFIMGIAREGHVWMAGDACVMVGPDVHELSPRPKSPAGQCGPGTLRVARSHREAESDDWVRPVLD